MWNVINYIYSCKAILSSSLHGLTCSDSYNNISFFMVRRTWTSKGDFKFLKIISKYKKISKFQDELLYSNGNTIDLDSLLKTFTFY